jgi:hypothetical protein
MKSVLLDGALLAIMLVGAHLLMTSNNSGSPVPSHLSARRNGSGTNYSETWASFGIAPSDSKYFVTMSVTMPYTIKAFDITLQQKYKTAIGMAAGTSAGNVEIKSVTEAGGLFGGLFRRHASHHFHRRGPPRRRNGGVDVETRVILPAESFHMHLLLISQFGLIMVADIIARRSARQPSKA